jgi:hypothetical protein
MSSWGRAQSCSKHVEDSNKHIIEEIVRQVGYLPELYEDTLSEKYKKLRDVFWDGYRLFSRDSN